MFQSRIDREEMQLPLLSFDIIANATGNFRENKLGKGGYGPVYKVTFVTFKRHALC